MSSAETVARSLGRLQQEFPANLPEQAVGAVTAVSGSRLAAELTSEGLQAAQIGALLKVAGPASQVYGIVTSLRGVAGPAGAVAGLADIELLGESLSAPDGAPRFQRGVSVYPGLGSVVESAAPSDLRMIFASPRGASVEIGTLHQDPSLPVSVMVDDMLGKHFAVLGTTGAGKSCAVALLLRQVLARNPFGHVVLLDPHNEYAAAFPGQAETIGLNNLQLPFWMLNFAESCEVWIGNARDAEIQASILKNAIVAAKKKAHPEKMRQDWITVDTPVPYLLAELIRNIDQAMGMLNKPEGAGPYLKLKSRIEDLHADKRFSFMFSNMTTQDILEQIMCRFLRVPVGNAPLTIIDLSGIPSEIVDVCVSVLARVIFDFCQWAPDNATVPVLLVCEEAHRYVPGDESAGFGPTRKALARIAKEGRKYGVSLGLVTQRPSELSASILSQCSTLFALRMNNEQDQDFVRRAAPESAHGFLGALPSLRAQEAVVMGEGVSVPVRLRFYDLPEGCRPQGGNAAFSKAWNSDSADPDFVRATLERWRRQNR